MDRPIVELHRCANLLRESGAGGLEGREDVVGVFEVVVVTGFITIQGLRESNENEQRERERRKIRRFPPLLLMVVIPAVSLRKEDFCQRMRSLCQNLI